LLDREDLVNDAHRIVLASSNAGKVREFAKLFPANVHVVSLRELGLESPNETGTTFAENAAIKAREISLLTDSVVVADDSGLEVDALGGEPGVYSARYSGEPPDDERNIDLLIEKLSGTLDGARTARFQCAVAVARRGEMLLTSSGSCEGTIGHERKGTNGFGYDPLFILSDGRTMAELTDDEKNQISHRAVAFRAVAGPLAELIEELAKAGESSW
jgi:XTP/dITP diphosphohydrolase